jgi:ABC-type glycerol-3-phosphate transport system permease component
MGLFLFTLIIQAGMIPTFLAVKDYGLCDTFWALILPEVLSVYNMIIMRTFFRSLPSELIEAAEIDGCSELKTLVKIVLPLSTPVLASIGLFYAVWHWNSWFDAVLYIT